MVRLYSDHRTKPQTQPDREFVAILRKHAEALIERNGKEWAAEKLGISVCGVETMLWRTVWTAAAAVHAASCLGLLSPALLRRFGDALGKESATGPDSQ